MLPFRKKGINLIAYKIVSMTAPFLAYTSAISFMSLTTFGITMKKNIEFLENQKIKGIINIANKLQEKVNI